jgi:hypothetical protein
MVILKSLEKIQIWTNYDEEILVTTFDCTLKGEMWTVFHSNGNNKINEKMVILEKFRKKFKFELNTTKKYLLQHLIAD